MKTLLLIAFVFVIVNAVVVMTTGTDIYHVDQWKLKSYHYVLTLEDEDWVEVRRADGTIVGMVQCDTSTAIGKLFYKDNE